ncbi:MAG: hypothetical protein E7407_03750 [Ruminococcaceae bacterium]|nr:hypothetical protein [Oscillospiraceae bacterium]
MSNRITYDEFGNMKIDGQSLSVRQNSYKVPQSFKQAIADIELQFKRASITEEQYYKKMEELRNTYLEKGTKEWWSYTNKIVSYEEKLVKEQQKLIEKTYSDISSKIYKTQAEILKSQEQFSKKLLNHTELYSSVKQTFKGIGENGSDVINYKLNLTDLDGAKESLTKYYDLLELVKERGEEHFGAEGFKEFFEILRDLPIDDAAAFSEALLKKNDEGFVDFVGDYKDIKEMSERFSKSIYSDDVKRAEEESLEYMKEKLSEVGMEIPEGFFVSGTLSAEKFSEGFVSQIEGVLADISKGFSDLLPKNDILLKATQQAEEKGNIFAPTYNLYGSGETIAQKLRSAQTQALIDKLRGGY